MKHPEPLFYIQREGGPVAGPYDLVQMASMLRKKIITAETMTRLEGEEDWKAFSWQPQFSIVREMPADAVSTRVIRLDDEAESAKQGAIPMPSAETIAKLVGLGVGVVVAAIIGFVFAWLDETVGYGLLVAGGGVALVAACLIYARMMDEDWLTLASIYFIPLYDIFYLISNIWVYFPLLAAKYLGGAVALGAALGLATHAGH